MSSDEASPFSQSYWEETNVGDDELGGWGPILQQALSEYVGPIDVAAELAAVKAQKVRHDIPALSPESNNQTQ